MEFHFLKSPAVSLVLPVLFTALVLACFPVVRSEHEESFIQLPSEAQPAEVCPVLHKSPVNALSCPVNCFRPDPVCGVNEVTYWCGCQEAQCAGVKVAKLGFCEVGNGGAVPLSAQALLLVHIVWLIVLGFSVLFGLF